MENILEKTQKVVDGLNEVLEASYIQGGFTCYLEEGKLIDREKFHIVPRRKYLNIDCSGSGAYMVEKKTGEIFNIKAYGCADFNKKRKSNIGNVATVDPQRMFKMRWNYLK